MPEAHKFFGGLLRIGVDRSQALLLSFREYVEGGHIPPEYEHRVPKTYTLNSQRAGLEPSKQLNGNRDLADEGPQLP